MSNLQRRLNEILAPLAAVDLASQIVTGLADPLAAQDAVTKSYADTLASSMAPLVSPAFAGVPTVPTAGVNTNTTQVASTAFVIGQGSSSMPTTVALVPEGATPGSSPQFSRADHVHHNNTLVLNSSLTGGTLGGVTWTHDSSVTISTSVGMYGSTQEFFWPGSEGTSTDAWFTGSGGGQGDLLLRGRAWSNQTSSQFFYNSGGYYTCAQGTLWGNSHMFQLYGMSIAGGVYTIIITMIY